MARNEGSSFNDAVLHSLSVEPSSTFSITAEKISSKTATLRWTNSDGCSSYSVMRYDEQIGRNEKYAVTGENCIELTNLTPNTEYKFVIATALTNKNLGAVKFKTQELVPVSEISVVAADYVKFNIQDLEFGAYVEIYKGESENKLTLIATADNSEFIDYDVEQGKQYYYKTVSVTASGRNIEGETVSVVAPVKMDLPNVSGSTKTYAHYTAVTAKSTQQYKLLNSKECYTDPETGIRMVDDCYCVALGSYYGSEIGTKYRIEFSTGKSIKVILCDQKSNRHTDSNNQYAVRNKDIIEFYVQKDMIPKSIRGNYGNLSKFEGDIVSIEKYV